MQESSLDFFDTNREEQIRKKFTIAETSKILGIEEWEVMRYIIQNRLEGVIFSRKWYISEESIQRFLLNGGSYHEVPLDRYAKTYVEQSKAYQKFLHKNVPLPNQYKASAVRKIKALDIMAYIGEAARLELINTGYFNEVIKGYAALAIDALKVAPILRDKIINKLDLAISKFSAEQAENYCKRRMVPSKTILNKQIHKSLALNAEDFKTYIEQSTVLSDKAKELWKREKEVLLREKNVLKTERQLEKNKVQLKIKLEDYTGESNMEKEIIFNNVNDLRHFLKELPQNIVIKVIIDQEKKESDSKEEVGDKYGK